MKNPIETVGFKTSMVANHHVVEDCIEDSSKIVVRTGPEHKGLPAVKTSPMGRRERHGD
jgi:hypothetical protein